MGLRAYLLIDVSDDVDQHEFIKIINELEEMPGVDFVDPVVGARDLVVTVDTPVSVGAIAAGIRSRNWVKNLDILKTIGMFAGVRSPKENLKQVLIESGSGTR